MNEDYEVFVGITEQGRKKSYIVAKTREMALKYAKKVLRVSETHISIQVGWVVDDRLYLRNPRIKRQKVVIVATYCA